MRLRPYWFQALLWLVLIGLIALIVLTAMEAQAQEVLDKKFIAVTSLTLGSAAFDAWSTNRNLDHGYIENNPILGSRPAKLNVWALTMGESAGWCTAAYFVKRSTQNSKSRVVRKLWLFFPTLSFSGHMYGGIHNVRIYDPIKYPKVNP